MSTEETERLRQAVRELADAVPVPETGPAAVQAAAVQAAAVQAAAVQAAAVQAAAVQAAAARAARTRWRQRTGGWRTTSRRWAPALAAVALLAVSAIGLLPASLIGPEHSVDTPAAGPVLPATFADHSYLTAHVSAAPAGPAIALYEYGIGDALWQTPQVITVGTDGRSYRELQQTAERGRRDVGLWRRSAASLLAPNGSRVAVEEARGPATDITVVDLTTGTSRRYPVPAGSAVQVLAWSSESSQLVYVIAPYQPDQHGDPRPSLANNGELTLLDLASGVARQIPGQRGALDAAFAPDGRRLAVQTAQELRLVTLDGVVERLVPVPTGHRLAGPAAWSPDGQRIALYELATNLMARDARVYWSPAGLTVTELTSGTATPIETDLHRVLGWRDGTILVHRGDEIVELPLDGGSGNRLATLQPGNDHFINEVQLASALLPELRIGENGVGRGPWPRWLRLSTAGVMVSLGLAVVITVRRRRGSRRGVGVRGPQGEPAK